MTPFSSATPNAGSSKLSEPTYLWTEGNLAGVDPSSSSSTPKLPQRRQQAPGAPSCSQGSRECEKTRQSERETEFISFDTPSTKPKSEAKDHVRGCAPAGFERKRSSSLSPNREKHGPLRFERVSSRSVSPPRRTVHFQQPTIFDFLYVA